MPEGSQDNLDDARRLDPDRGLTLLFAAPADRPLLASLVLFNAELARIPDVVREPMAGMIRYQWWRGKLDEIAAGRVVVEHPLLPALEAGVRAGLVDLAGLEALIDAREAELDRLRPADLDQLEAYAAATSGRLQALIARACGATGDIVEAAGAAGIGYALVGLLRALGFHLARGRLPLPADLLEREQLGADDVLEARNAEALARVRKAILARAARHLDVARGAGPLPRRVMPALLPARIARRQARRLEGPKAASDAWLVPDLFWHWLIRRV